MDVTPQQKRLLKWFSDNGGECYVDGRSRLVACSTANHLWMGHGIVLTDAGREFLSTLDVPRGT
jgi:hypothetical protein